MSLSTDRVAPPHVLVQSRDARGRLGSLHAAIASETGWWTACGVEISAGPAVSVWHGAVAHSILALPGARRCARCDRVGDAAVTP